MIYNEFIESLLIYKHIKQIEKIGIFDTNLCKTWELNFYVNNVFIYKNNGDELINFCFDVLENVYSKNNILFKKLVTSSYLNNTTFSHVFLNDKKISLFRNHLIFIIVTNKKVQENLSKLYLEFISNVFFNFIGDNQENRNIYNISKIFEIFFLKYLTIKFTDIIKFLLIKRENIMMNSQTKLKNILFIDCKTNTIIFNLKSLLKKNGIIKKLSNRTILWHTIINNLNTFKDYYSTKIELFSTFPRLSFISRFIKINNGMAIIECYSSNKLSRNSNEYCEFEFSFQKIKEKVSSLLFNNSLKYLDYFENFLILYFTSLSSKYYLYNNLNAELPYFDDEYLNIIDDSLQIRMSFENLISYLYKKIELKFLQKNKEKSTKTLTPINKHYYFLIIEKSEILKSLYHSKINYETKISIDDNKIIDNNNNFNYINNNNEFAENISEISVIEKITEDILSESIISDIKERQMLMSNSTIIEENKNGENTKKDIKDLLKSIQFKLVNFGENGSPISTFSIKKNKSQIIENSNNNSFIQIQNVNNQYISENKRKINELNDITEFYGDRSSQEIIYEETPTFANLNNKTFKFKKSKKFQK